MKRTVYKNAAEFLEQNEALGTGLPFTEDLGILSQSLAIGSRVIPNRFCCQPMESCSALKDNTPDEITLRHYRSFAGGGSGLVWLEATAVLPEAKANTFQLYIDADNLDAYKRTVEEIKKAGAERNGVEPMVILQLTHSGRYSKPHGYPEPIVAGHIPSIEKDKPLPEECIATDEYLDRVRDALVAAAGYAEKAGFDGADIKCCHGYLLSELMGAHTRKGRYGGSLENRSRLLREAVKGAIENAGDFIITARVNAWDGLPWPYGFGVPEDGSTEFDPAEPAWVLKQLAEYGMELIDITMGNPYVIPHVNRPFFKGGYEPEEHPLVSTARILKGTGILKKRVPELKVVCSGLSWLGSAAPGVAAAMIREGSFDIAGFGRETFAYPDFARDVMLKGGFDPAKQCLCCSKCTDIMRTGNPAGCPVRDQEVYLPLYKKYCQGEK
ncbi:MAG: flavin oxidoreductase/NADH oxidase [Abditibacteriota bacterium]|nr:flavin oxidoreductase/NADH oxidase [Abditibacteriota bacterium]